MIRVLRLHHRDPREFTLADAPCHPPIVLVLSMFCRMNLILLPLCIIITLDLTIPRITRIYRLLFKPFNLIFPYLLLPSRIFLHLDVHLLFQFLITYILLLFHLIRTILSRDYSTVHIRFRTLPFPQLSLSLWHWGMIRPLLLSLIPDDVSSASYFV